MKLFRDAKTSDGDPADEMAAAAVAGGGAGSSGGEGSCPSIVRSYGRLDEGAAKTAAAALASAPSSSSSSSLGSTGLVLQLLDGWKALAGPPSFASVTRDVYDGDGGKLVDAASGECTERPAAIDWGKFGAGEVAGAGEGVGDWDEALAAAVGVLRAVAAAAATLHGRGISHGDLYGHNILLRPKGAATAAAEATPPSAVLSDFGASFFYKQPSSSSLSSSSSSSTTTTGEDQSGSGSSSGSGSAPTPEHLLERLEVLAFGHLASELLQRLPQTSDEKSAQGMFVETALQLLVVDCRQTAVAQRPSFRDIENRITAAETGSGRVW